MISLMRKEQTERVEKGKYGRDTSTNNISDRNKICKRHKETRLPLLLLLFLKYTPQIQILNMLPCFVTWVANVTYKPGKHSKIFTSSRENITFTLCMSGKSNEFK